MSTIKDELSESDAKRCDGYLDIEYKHSKKTNGKYYLDLFQQTDVTPLERATHFFFRVIGDPVVNNTLAAIGLAVPHLYTEQHLLKCKTMHHKTSRARAGAISALYGKIDHEHRPKHSFNRTFANYYMRKAKEAQKEND